MDDRSWDKIVDAIDAKFGISDHGRRTEPLEDKPELSQKVSFICFTKGGEDFKLERVTGPAIIDRKTHYHRVAGSGVRFENIYDPEELAHKTLMFRREAGEWAAIDPSELSL